MVGGDGPGRRGVHDLPPAVLAQLRCSKTTKHSLFQMFFSHCLSEYLQELVREHVTAVRALLKAHDVVQPALLGHLWQLLVQRGVTAADEELGHTTAWQLAEHVSKRRNSTVFVFWSFVCCSCFVTLPAAQRDGGGC